MNYRTKSTTDAKKVNKINLMLTILNPRQLLI